jgi:tetratricopeptide (TPR) repeat protein
MKKIAAILFCCVAFVLSSRACLNDYFTFDKEGHVYEVGEMFWAPFNTNFNKELIVSKLHKMQTKLQQEHSFMLLSDYAVALLKLGKVNEGLDILVELSYHYPGEYKIASNLGTAYELHGDVDSALKYIRRGMELNPNDHGGSEWIHVKILETKKEIAKDPSWLSKHTVLQLTEKQKNDSVVRRQLRIQLDERFPFSPGPDVMMASMFVDLGDLYLNTFSVGFAIVSYELAKNYYGDNTAALETKIKETRKLLKKSSEINLPRTRMEGQDVILGTQPYKTMLGDNDPGHYQIDWNKISYDPKVLLGMVNLEMTVKEVREKALKNQTGDLKLVNDSSNVKSGNENYSYPEQGRGKTNSWMIVLLSSITAIMLGSLIYRMMRKRGNN